MKTKALQIEIIYYFMVVLSVFMVGRTIKIVLEKRQITHNNPDTKCKEFYGQEYSYIRGKEVCATKEGDIRFYELIE